MARQAPLLLRFSELERRVLQNAVRQGTEPRVSESAFIRGAAIMFALALEDKRGVELVTELANLLERKHRGSARQQLADSIRLFGSGTA